MRLSQCLFYFVLSSFLVACSGLTPSSDSATSTQAEASYCSATYPTTAPHVLTGTANYQYRAISCGTMSCTGLAAGTTSRGIPHAELIVRNSAGSTVQCGHTNADGTFSVTIDKVPDTYTVSVNSRAFNSEIKASVLADVSSNSVYTVTSNSFTVTSGTSSPQAVGTFAASLTTPEVKGAAFHILYNLWTANEFLRANTSNSAFVADKVSVYWKAGFNPGSYVNAPTTLLSFYIKGSSQLYILGGYNGNSSTIDFDHFDDSVILHEYAHFLEDVYSESDSQGGSHNGNFIIDPRLAWSEGWANYFQAAVVRQLVGGVNDNVRGRYYIDITNGSSVGLIFTLNASGQATTTDQVNFDGEGIFREISISRTLWKATATNGTVSNPAAGEVPFTNVWDTFTNSIFKNTTVNFRNSGLFNSVLDATIVGAGNRSRWIAIIDDEFQNITTEDYADSVSLVTMNTCTAYPRNLDPVVDPIYGGSTARSNLEASNDFYAFTYSGGGGSINLTYTQLNGTIIDLDLYLYRQGYVYQEDASESNSQFALKSDRANPSIETGSETLNLSSLAAGTYLLNVKANTLNKNSGDLGAGVGRYTLRMTQGSTTWDLCPAN